jgi:hypothetical protein
MQKDTELKKANRGKNESVKVSPRGKISENTEKEQLIVPNKSKKRKIEYIHNESMLKNEQKTMQLSRNTVQHSKYKDDRDYDFDRRVESLTNLGKSITSLPKTTKTPIISLLPSKFPSKTN